MCTCILKHYLALLFDLVVIGGLGVGDAISEVDQLDLRGFAARGSGMYMGVCRCMCGVGVCVGVREVDLPDLGGFAAGGPGMCVCVRVSGYV